MRLNYTLVVTIFCCLFSPLFLFSQSTIWNGSESTDWFTAANWSNGLPTNGNDAVINDPNLARLPIINQVLEVNFTINNTAILRNEAQIIIAAEGVFNNFTDGDFINNGQVINSGDVMQQGTWQNNGELINQGSLTNNGMLNNGANAQIINVSNLVNNGDLQNAGTLFNQGDWRNNLNIINTGMLVNQGNFAVGFGSNLQNSSVGTINNVANFTVEGMLNNNGTIDNAANWAILSSGTLENNNQIVNNNLFTNSGTLNNAGDFTNTNQFINEFGNSDFNNTGNATNASCATFTQRSNLVIQNILNNGIVNQIDGVDVTVLPASQGIILSEPGDVAAPEIRCVANFSTRIGSQGQVVITPSDIDDGSTASYCRIVSRAVTPNVFTCADFGQHEVTLIVTDALGVESRCKTQITIEGNLTNGIACNNNVNFSIPDICEPVELTYDVILEGGYDCEAGFTVQIEGREKPIVTGNDVGETLKVYIIDPNSTSNCWGNVTIEDKTAPVFLSCPDAQLFCIDNPAPVSEGGDVPNPVVKDCTGFTLEYYDDMNSQSCAFDTPESIERTWVAVGANGMRSECTQMITIENISLRTYPVQCPEDVQLACRVDGAEVDISPENTGFPYVNINGIRTELNHDSLSLCGIGATYRDAVFTDICGVSQKIYRSWTAFEWCDASTVFTCLQIIEIIDTEAPIIEVTMNISANTNVVNCGAAITLPPAAIMDCSEVTVRIETAAGTINGNGGQIPEPGLPLGENVVTYIAVDACGNETRKDVTVNIDDKTPPQATCVENLNVSLNNDGFAQLFPESIDEGSRDNCGIEKLEVYRLDSPCGEQEIPGMFTTFSCCDVANSPIRVVLRVTDFAGNFNECEMNVFVEDKIQPQILCPPAKTVTCVADLEDLVVTGQAFGTDNCDNLTITYRDDLSALSDCNLGTVRRTWTATSPRGETISCVQTIEIYNDNPFDGNRDITWPADVEHANCVGESDPEFTGEPIFRSTGCNEVYATYRDEVFTDVDDACLKILREWTVLDWCEYGVADTSEWVYYQSIKFVDNNPPVFMECRDLEICNENNECSAVVNVPANVTDNCLGEEQIDLFWEVDLFADNNRDEGDYVRGNGQNINSVYPNGTHRITYFAVDGCGNQSECSFNFTVKDCKAPVSTCISGYTAGLMPNGAITIDITKVISGSSFDNCTDYADLRFSFSNNVNDQTRTYNCNNIGANPIEIWTTDLDGNQSFCSTQITIQDQHQMCPERNVMANLSGLIRNEIGDVVEGVEVHANYNQQMTYTDHMGEFQLVEIPTNANYTLTPVRANDPKNGVSTLDLILIRKHILGIKLLDSPYKMIAADVNASREITTLDMIQIRRLILNLETEFADSPAWRFIPADYQFADANEPFATDFPELYDINNLRSDMNDIDFIAIKMGDVNTSAITNNLQETDERSSGETFYLDVAATAIEDDISTLTFTSADSEKMQGAQFVLTAAAGVELLALETGVFSATHFNLTEMDNGKIVVSWNKTEKIGAAEILFQLKIRAPRGRKANAAVTIESSVLAAEAYNNLDELVNIAIRNKNGTMVAKDNFVLQANQPNPFREQTTIHFALPMATTATLTIFDATGNTVYQHRQAYAAGRHQHKINATQLGTTGVLYYQLATAAQVETRKMMKLR